MTPEEYSLESILRFAQSHRSNLKVIPAPGQYLDDRERPSPQKIAPILDILADNGYHLLLDVGAHLTPLALAALKRADKTFVITSGQPESNLHLDTFLASAENMGLDPRRLMPVINELHGEIKGVKLTRVPVARIPHTTERLRTRLWLTEQGLQKLVNVALSRTTPIA
jgi:MinD-like ATPase involved in chromosome partitioning or flagellar assembly